MSRYVRFLVVVALTLLSSISLIGAAFAAQMTEEFQRGTELYNAREYSEAAKCFEKVVAGDPSLAGLARYQIGMCDFEQRMLDEAIRVFQSALSASRPQDTALVAKIKVGLVRVYIEAGESTAASALMQQIAPGDPETAGHLLFMSCLGQRDYERAAAVLIYSLVSAPGVEHIGANGLPTWLLSSSDRTSVKHCVQSFCDAVARGGQISAVPAVRVDLQAMLEKCGMTDGAAAAAATFTQTDTAAEHAATLYNVAAVYFRGGKHKQAAPLFEDVLKSGVALDDSRRASSLYLLGLCKWHLEESDAAKSCMSEIVTGFPHSGKAKWAKAHLASWSKTGASKDR